MANRIVIDVEAQFVDKVTSAMNSANKSVSRFEKTLIVLTRSWTS